MLDDIYVAMDKHLSFNLQALMPDLGCYYRIINTGVQYVRYEDRHSRSTNRPSGQRSSTV